MANKRSGTDNGSNNSADSGDAQRGMMDMPEFVAFAGANLSALKPDVLVTRAAPGRQSMGARLGTMPLAPLETLEDRISDAFPGVHTLRVFARALGGQYAACGEIELASAAVSAPASSDPVLAQLLADNRELKARLEKLAATPAAPAADPLDMLGKLMGFVRELSGPPAPPPPSAAEQLKQLSDTLTAAKSVASKFGGDGGDRTPFTILAEAASPGVKDLVAGVGALLAARAGEKAEAYEHREDARRKEAQAQSTPTRADA